MDIQKVPINKIKPAKYNPRKDLKPGDAEYEKLRRSIEEFGYVEPVIWNSQTGNIIGGHQRFKVLSALGYAEIDCVVLDVDEQREKALNIALNKIGGEFDIPLLTDLLKDIGGNGFDVSLTGFDAAEISELFGDSKAAVEEDNANLIPDKQTRCKLGDLFLLGKSRLLIGDSVNPYDISRLMDGEKAHMIFTDLPWSVSYGQSAHPSYRKRTILNDSMTPEQFKEFLHKAFENMLPVILSGAMIYSVMGIVSWSIMDTSLRELGFHLSSVITWHKNCAVMSQGDYHQQTEHIWYGWLSGAPRLCPLKDRKQTTFWDIARPTRSKNHPMTKPLELCARAIQNSSYPGNLIIDFFGGSGSTLIAAQKTERRCNMMELDPHYAELIVHRYAENFGATDIKLNRDGKEMDYEVFLKLEPV